MNEIADCEVSEESDVGMKRIMKFKPGMGPPGGIVTEILTFHGESTVCIPVYLWFRDDTDPIFLCEKD
jgi:hypothetical protein